MAKILIIADLHLGAEKLDVKAYKHDDIRTDLTQLSEDQLELLSEAIEQKYRENPMDILVFLGDCVRARDTEDERKEAMDRFTSFLCDLEKKSVFSKVDGINERIVIIPGNHDVVRTESGKGSLDRFKAAFAPYITPFAEKGNDKSIKRFGAPVFVYDDLQLIISCFSTASLHDGAMPSILAEAQKRFDQANRTLQNKSNSPKYNHFARIVFSHSPLLTLEAGRTVVKFNNTIGGYDLFQTAAFNGYNLFFHGHTHQYGAHKIGNLLKTDICDAVQISVPRCAYTESSDIVGLTVIEVETITKDRSAAEPREKEPCSYKIRHFSIDKTRKMFTETKSLVSDERQDSGEAVWGDRILTDTQIEQVLKEGIIIQNGDSSRIEAASYDCALGRQFKREQTEGGYDWGLLETIEPNDADAAEIKLQPGQTVLIYTEEEFNLPLDMVFHASPISSWARKGLRVDISYFVDPGFRGPFSFPVRNTSSHEISISSRERIMSIELVKIAKPAEKGWIQRNPIPAEIRAKRGE